jgi:hypothetical protein
LLGIEPKIRGLKPGRGNGFLRAIKISKTPYFGDEVKPSAPCHKILLYAKELYEYFVDKIYNFIRPDPTVLLLDGSDVR